MATLETLESPVVAPASVPQARPPRLSEAIRYGQMNTKQAFETFVARDGSLCALSTAWYGMGYDVSWRNGLGQFVLEHPEWGFLLENIDTAPLCNGVCIEGGRHCGKQHSLGYLMVHFNDDHRMPRNEIADRLSAFGL